LYLGLIIAQCRCHLVMNYRRNIRVDIMDTLSFIDKVLLIMSELLHILI